MALNHGTCQGAKQLQLHLNFIVDAAFLMKTPTFMLYLHTAPDKQLLNTAGMRGCSAMAAG